MGGEPSKILHGLPPPATATSSSSTGDADQQPPPPPRPTLLHGGANVLSDPDFYSTHGVTHALSICQAKPPPTAGLTMVRHINESDLPHTNLLPHFETFIHFIHESRVSGGVVYVHCAAGVSRSTTAVCSYLMCIHALSFKDALDFIRTRREVACPNPGFVQQLQTFEKDHKTILSMRQRIRQAFPHDLALVENDLREIREALAERAARLGRGEKATALDPRDRIMEMMHQMQEQQQAAAEGMRAGEDDESHEQCRLPMEAPPAGSSVMAMALGERGYGLTWLEEEKDHITRRDEMPR